MKDTAEEKNDVISCLPLFCFVVSLFIISNSAFTAAAGIYLAPPTSVMVLVEIIYMEINV